MEVTCKCEKCGDTFDDLDEGLLHEESCKGINFKCRLCGGKDVFDLTNIKKLNSHHIFHLGVMGYGSLLDGKRIKLSLCDYCLAMLAEEDDEKECQRG